MTKRRIPLALSLALLGCPPGPDSTTQTAPTTGDILVGEYATTPPC